MEFGSLSKRPLHFSPRRRLLLLPCAFKATKDMNTADPDQLHGRLPAYLLLPSLHPSQLRKNLGFWEGAYAIEEVKEVQGKLVHLMTTSLLSRPASPQKPWTSHGGILARDAGISRGIRSCSSSCSTIPVPRLSQVSQTQSNSTCFCKKNPSILQADVFWLKNGDSKFPILSVVDQGTLFQARSPRITSMLPRKDGSTTLDHLPDSSLTRAEAGLVLNLRTGPMPTASNMWWLLMKLMNFWRWLSVAMQFFAKLWKSSSLTTASTAPRRSSRRCATSSFR